MQIRKEHNSDIFNIYALNQLAFETSKEANLVNSIRENVDRAISLVATNGDEIIGHIMFSPVTIANNTTSKLYGLAPMAVDPRSQNSGIGTLLVKAGLEECQGHRIKT